MDKFWTSLKFFNFASQLVNNSTNSYLESRDKFWGGDLSANSNFGKKSKKNSRF